MKVCPHCQSVSFDDMETCFGCLRSFRQQSAADQAVGEFVDEAQSAELAGALVEARDSSPLVIEAEASSSERQGRAPLEITRDEVSRAIVVTDPSREQVGSRAAGMARLHVRLPQGYHYDVYLEKPEGASIQLGWVPAPE